MGCKICKNSHRWGFGCVTFKLGFSSMTNPLLVLDAASNVSTEMWPLALPSGGTLAWICIGGSRSVHGGNSWILVTGNNYTVEWPQTIWWHPITLNQWRILACLLLNQILKFSVASPRLPGRRSVTTRWAKERAELTSCT